MSIEELSIEQKNKLITEAILGECWHEFRTPRYANEGCRKCEVKYHSAVNRNFYEGDRSYKDIADAYERLGTESFAVVNVLWRDILENVLEEDEFKSMDEYRADAIALDFLLLTPAQKADTLVKMILEQEKPK